MLSLRIIGRGALLLLLVSAGTVFAQDTESTSPTFLDEITVTARKTEESIQDVPLAISAYTSAEMTRRSMQELEDVALATAGFAFEDFGGGYGVPVIRGGAQLDITALDQSASVYMDGIYLPRGYMLDVGTVGFDRIEVVKGPQSALFGRNAFLGAVNYISGGPSEELDLKLEVMAGTDERFDAYAEIGGPIIEGMLAARVLFGSSEFDGSWTNDNPNAASFSGRGTEGNVGGWDNTTIGVNLDFQPSDALSIDLDYYNVDRFNELAPDIRVEAGAGDTNCSATFFGGNRYYCGEIPTTYTPLPGGSPEGSRITKDPRSFSLDAQTEFFHLGVALDLTENWSINYQFGDIDAEVVSAGSGDRDPVVGSFNFFNPAQPVNYVNFTPIGTNEYTSHELRVEFNTGPWSGFFGVFTSEIKDRELFDFGLAPLGGLEPYTIDPILGVSGTTALQLTRTGQIVDTDAIFGRLAWESTDGKWRVGAEARYTDETKSFDTRTTDPASPNFSGTWSPFTPRFTVDRQLNDDQMMYVSVAKGARSGGINSTVFDESQRTYEPDENWTLELGSKNVIMDGRLLLNAAVYYTDWNDQQIQTTPTGLPPGVIAPGIVDNTAGASIIGIELDGAWYATENFVMDYAVSYSLAEFDSGSISGRIASNGGCDDVVCPSDGSIGGNELPRQPPFQMSVGGTYSGTFANDWDWFVRGDVSYQDEQYIEELNLAWLPTRTLVNARISLSNGPWTMAVWARNLFDEDYAQNSFFIATPFGTSYVPLLGEQQTMGLTLTFDLL
jgi:iron complex outermembrane receptor protein